MHDHDHDYDWIIIGSGFGGSVSALRLADGFTTDLFEARTGLPFTCVRDPIDRLLDEGLLEETGPGLRASRLGWRFLDDVVARFFADETVIARLT